MMKTSKVIPYISIVFTFIVYLLGLSSAQAQTSQWAVKMFGEIGTERTYDFGNVALNAKAEKSFRFKNIYDEDVVISSVASNCGCTKAHAVKSVVHPNEIGEIIAHIDTTGEHTKQRKATIRITFSKPSFAEVQLQVKSYIRPDVGFEPGQIEFGTVHPGEKIVKKAYLQYAGRPDWALTGIQKTNPGVRAEAREVKREGGNVVYEILVELKSDAKPGYLQDLLKFQTNELDRATATIFLPIQGLVSEPLSAKPSYLQMGVVSGKAPITKNIVISSSEPFKIVDVSCNDRRLSFLKTNLTRAVHVVPVTFNADENVGNFSDDIVVSVKQADETVQKIIVPATGIVISDQLSQVETIGDSANVSQMEENNARQPDENRPKTVERAKRSQAVRIEKLDLNEASSGWTPVLPDHSPQKLVKQDSPTRSTVPELETWYGAEESLSMEKESVQKSAQDVKEPLNASTIKVTQVSNEETSDFKALLK